MSPVDGQSGERGVSVTGKRGNLDPSSPWPMMRTLRRYSKHPRKIGRVWRQSRKILIIEKRLLGQNYTTDKENLRTLCVLVLPKDFLDVFLNVELPQSSHTLLCNLILRFLFALKSVFIVPHFFFPLPTQIHCYFPFLHDKWQKFHIMSEVWIPLIKFCKRMIIRETHHFSF